VSSPTLNGGSMATRFNHNTNDEILYIQNIGKTSLKTEKIPRHVLLKQYIHSWELRGYDDSLDKDVILAFANKELYEALNE
jgi:hypothetical protein